MLHDPPRVGLHDGIPLCPRRAGEMSIPAIRRAEGIVVRQGDLGQLLLRHDLQGIYGVGGLPLGIQSGNVHAPHVVRFAAVRHFQEAVEGYVPLVPIAIAFVDVKPVFRVAFGLAGHIRRGMSRYRAQQRQPRHHRGQKQGRKQHAHAARPRDRVRIGRTGRNRETAQRDPSRRTADAGKGPCVIRMRSMPRGSAAATLSFVLSPGPVPSSAHALAQCPVLLIGENVRVGTLRVTWPDAASNFALPPIALAQQVILPRSSHRMAPSCRAAFWDGRLCPSLCLHDRDAIQQVDDAGQAEWHPPSIRNAARHAAPDIARRTRIQQKPSADQARIKRGPHDNRAETWHGPIAMQAEALREPSENLPPIHCGSSTRLPEPFRKPSEFQPQTFRTPSANLLRPLRKPRKLPAKCVRIRPSRLREF